MENITTILLQEFVAEGEKVKATWMLRGREIQHTNLVEDLLMRLAKDLEPVAELQQAPKKEGRNMTMILTPKKLVGKGAD